MKQLDMIPPLDQIQTADERWMREALKEAVKAFEKDEVPVGAVLVMDNTIISRGHNQVELLRDATAHAEMLCITTAENALGNWRLNECTLYCTLEPCAMCAGAMLLSRVGRLVWGARDVRHGANGSWVDLFAKPHPTHVLPVVSGVLQPWCENIMKTFFRKKRATQDE